MGKDGLKNLAVENINKARYVSDRLSSIGFEMPFGTEFFNEFVAIPPIDAGELNSKLLSENIHGALSLEKRFPELRNALLYGITEMHSMDILDKMVGATKEIVGGKHV